MTKLRTALILPLFLFLAHALVAETETVKILGIGNSFTNNAHHFLKDIYDSVDGADADIGTAFIGGCSLERHVRHAKEQEANPESGKEYTYRYNWKVVGSKMSLKEILLAEDWDVISIQQVSTQSYKPESFEPYADELIAYIRQYRPEAEIVVHETWSHSVNSPRAKTLIEPNEMYAKLHANYTKLAEENGFRMIPAGTAFQNARATDMWDLQPNDFDPKNAGLTYPEDKDKLPDMSKSLNNDYFWKKTDQGWVVAADGFHANTAGEYLAGLVWFEVLSGRPAMDVTFKPDALTDEQASSLREIAMATVKDSGLACGTPAKAAACCGQ